jgi:hypothetical protein
VARLAFAIDASIDIFDLVRPQIVDPQIAQALCSALGQDVLIYRIGETQSGYYGLARLISIGAVDNRSAYAAFDSIRMFQQRPLHPEGVVVLTRLQFLDEYEFDAVVSRAMPVSVLAALAELEQQPIEGAPGAEAESTANNVCAFTGEPVSNGDWTMIWPQRPGGGTAGNVLALTPDAKAAFLSGHFAARDDLSIVSGGDISRHLLRRLNPGGKLLVPLQRNFRPSEEALAWHRHFVAGLL